MLLKSNSGKVVVGYDLGSVCSRISYCFMGEERSAELVETVSAVAGSESYSIPTVLCKKSGTNQWLYGREALRYAEEEEDGILVDDLLALAMDGEPVQIEGESYEPIALLTLFLKRSLSLLTAAAATERFGALMITCRQLDRRMLGILEQAVAGLKLKNCRVCFQSYTESFYHYILSQPTELWAYQTLLCDYQQNRIQVYRLEYNKRTAPVVVYVEEECFDFPAMELMPHGEDRKQEWLRKLDGKFLDLMEELCTDRLISSVFLIGENYSEEWMKESLRYLCRGRRVFQGSNLYSKGACLGMMERLSPSELGREYVFLGNDKLKANIGMRVLRRGEDSYYALLDAGNNWFETDSSCEFYLQEENQIELVITPLIGQKEKVARISLDGLNSSPVRLAMHLTLPREDCLQVEIEDLGFGEFIPASHKIWKEEIEIYG